MPAARGSAACCIITPNARHRCGTLSAMRSLPRPYGQRRTHLAVRRLRARRHLAPRPTPHRGRATPLTRREGGRRPARPGADEQGDRRQAGDLPAHRGRPVQRSSCKLGFTSRTQIATWAVEHRTAPVGTPSSDVNADVRVPPCQAGLITLGPPMPGTSTPRPAGTAHRNRNLRLHVDPPTAILQEPTPRADLSRGAHGGPPLGARQIPSRDGDRKGPARERARQGKRTTIMTTDPPARRPCVRIGSPSWQSGRPRSESPPHPWPRGRRRRRIAARSCSAW